MGTDPVALTAALVRCPSVTPTEGGALQLLHSILEPAGFDCSRVDRNGISNLFARWGAPTNGPTFGFNGHTDVVPIGNRDDWSVDPFGAEIRDGFLYGRGATDMKSGVAAFAAAAIDFVSNTPPNGSVALLITGDEEGVALDGTRALLDWMETTGERMDHCLVGEPTSPEHMGQMIKIGRRGSMTARITASGKQGHSAYPHRANNPLPALVTYLDRLARYELDTGTEHFDPTTLAITTIDVGNPANNVIPAEGRATVNIRFNDAHTGDSLSQWLRSEASAVTAETGVAISLDLSVSGESFLTKPGPFSAMVAAAIETEIGVTPEMSTSGGTSDARFITTVCPVVEFGLVGKTMHEVDERVSVDQIVTLKAIYTRILERYFSKQP